MSENTTQSIPVIPITTLSDPLVTATPDEVASAPVEDVPVKNDAKTEEEINFGKRFAALSKKEAALQARETKLKAEAAQLEQIKAENQNWSQVKAEAKKNPQKVMEELGISYDYLTRYILNDNKPPADAETEELRAEIKKVNERIDKENQERQAAELKQQGEIVDKALNMYWEETKQYIAANPEQYELIVANDAQEDVCSLIESWFFKFGEVLTKEQAAQKVEDHLFSELKRLSSTKKVASLFPAPAPEAIKVSPRDVRDRPRPSQTITNDAISPEPVGGKPMTPEEKLQRAAALLQFNEG